MLIIILLIILFCLVFLIIDKERHIKSESGRTSSGRSSGQAPFAAKAPQPAQPEDYITPVLSIAEGACMVMSNNGLERFIFRDYELPKKQITRENIHEVLVDILRFLELPDIVALIVNDGSDSVHTNGTTNAGSYNRNMNGYRTVSINIESFYGLSNIMAILCHECTHYFMEYHKLNWNDTELNEQRTDIVANLIGFNQIMTNGYREFNEVRKTTNQTITHKIGYITSRDCEDLKYFLERRRKELKKERKLRAERKRKIATIRKEFMKHLETAETLILQLDMIDLSKLNASSSEEAMNIQRVLMEKGSRNMNAELQIYRECLKKDFDSLEQAEKEHQNLYKFCSELSSWLSVLRSKSEEEKMLENLKKEFIKYLETAETLILQLDMIDLSKLNASTSEHAMKIQRVLMEKESRNIKSELQRYGECLKKNFNSVEQAESERKKLYEFCTELLSWLKILQER